MIYEKTKPQIGDLVKYNYTNEKHIYVGIIIKANYFTFCVKWFYNAQSIIDYPLNSFSPEETVWYL